MRWRRRRPSGDANTLASDMTIVLNALATMDAKLDEILARLDEEDGG